MKLKRKFLSISCISILAAPALAQEVEWSVESGVGYETNVYHAPDHDYIDTALPSLRPAGVAVSPQEVDSVFIPIEADVSIRNKVNKNADFVGELKFDTDVMLDSEAEDATRTNVNLDLGVDYQITKMMRNKKTGKRTPRKRGEAYLGMFISTHDQVYVDRDTGLPKATTTGGVDISNKYSYQSFGIQGEYARMFGKNEYSVSYVLEDLNYETPQTGAEYDHVFNKLELGIKREFTKTTDLEVNYSYSMRDYSDRYARDLSGTYSSVNNDLLKYVYSEIGLDLGHRFSKKLKTHFEITNTVRSDEFVGYNDYTKLALALRARYKYSKQTTLRGKIKSYDIDYDNALNFENPVEGEKESSGLDLSFKAVHKWHKNKSYYLELKHTDRVSTDDRYDYTNDLIVLGAKWQY